MVDLGCSGFLETDERLFGYIEKCFWTIELGDRLNDYLRSHFPAAPPDQLLSVREIPEENWNEQWERSIQPVEIGDRLVVLPTWSDYQNKDDRIVLLIDPKMSFGTGHHETTRLALRLMDRYDLNGKTVLDVGTGSGILAIAAVKLGASHATGIDIDEWSIENARENVLLNKVEKSVDIFPGQPADVKKTCYDLIASNITLNANIAFLGDYRRLLSNDGMLLLSGFLKSDIEKMEKQLVKNVFAVQEVAAENEWVAISAVKAA